MNNKKTDPGVGSTEIGQQMQLDLGVSAPLEIHYNALPGSIANVLMTGRNNALTANEICRITGLPFRVVTRKILQERRSGCPIMSSPDSGYWIASDREEIVKCVNALHSRAKSIHATAAALQRITRE